MIKTTDIKPTEDRHWYNIKVEHLREFVKRNPSSLKDILDKRDEILATKYIDLSGW